MKNVRNSVFETNSSSSHSIHISKEVTVYDNSLVPNSNGVVYITGGQFGWEYEEYDDAITKATYCATPGSGLSHKLLTEALEKHTGAKEVVIDISKDDYIDHQSCGLLNELKTVEDVINFIFNPNCILTTDNDNH